MLHQRVSWFLAWARLLGLALALLLPPLLGLLHGVAHERALPVKRAHVDHGQSRMSSLASLFAFHDGGSPDCRLYDLASHDGLATRVAAVSLPPHFPGIGVTLFAGDAIARWAAQFEARGPPLTS